MTTTDHWPLTTDHSLSALIRATALVADGLTEERLLPLLARCAAEAGGAELAAVDVQLNQPASGKSEWRLCGHYGGDPEVLAALPRSYGGGGGVLGPVFQSAHEVCESDLLGVSAGGSAQHREPV